MTVRSRHQPKRPWRMTATFAVGQSKTIAYASQAAAERSAAFEKSCGAIRTRVWRKEAEWNED